MVAIFGVGESRALGLMALLLAASCGSVSSTGEDGGAIDAQASGADGAARADGGEPPARTFLYVANIGSDDLSVFEVDPDDGGLTPAGTVATGAGPGSVTVDRSNRFLYVLAREDSALYQYAIDQESGAPTAMSPASVPTGNDPFGVVSAGTDYLYVANGADETISGYEIDSGSGHLTELSGSPFSVGPALTQTNAPRYTAVNADDDLLIIGLDSEEGVADELRVFPIDAASGALSEPDVYSLGPDRFPILGAADPDHQFFFSILRETDEVQAYQIDAAGDLTPAGGAVSTGDGPFGVAVHPAQPYLYVSNFFADTVSLYQFDAGGALTFVSSTATGDGPETIAFGPEGRTMYIPNFVDETVSVFQIDPATGVPAPVGGSPPTVGTQPLWIAAATIRP